MGKASYNRSAFHQVFAMALLLAVAGCTTKDGGSGTVAGGLPSTSGEQKVSQSELRAYCPNVTLREGTAFFNTYEKGGEKDNARIVYQAAITDVTRACQYAPGTTTMDVAAAGKIVPGPQFKAGTITMPIRVVVTQGDSVLYSKLHKYQVSVSDPASATQFVFNDKGISFPTPAVKDIQVFVGYDEGPYNTK
ncbi:hypothetical protein C5748_00770 [Phyllobacterium phragmitis]|uniref:Lipoprotein n=1 Tax=Phyllobacterium phragmitis TaxID=2670329 RepID=A0A2S9IYZ9_9HYPH|nr:hypothetical protein [Phyllobacterium phragmitis]PRD45728.1 hypothetical protein C5748_00770 [Phyllobacterium phragmitis]